MQLKKNHAFSDVSSGHPIPWNVGQKCLSVTHSCHTETFSSYNEDKGVKMVENPNTVHSIAML